ncbi:MAG: hypothetical protein WBE40_03705 [Thermoplasmata archaeon]
MRRGIERAAVYVPRGTRSGRRVAGPDEDAFTLAATALERLWVGNVGPGPIGGLLLVGDLPPAVDGDLLRFIGSAPSVVRHGGGSAGLREALASAREPGRAAEPALVVAVDCAGSERTPSAPDAALALLVSDRGTVDPETVWNGEAEDSRVATAGVLRYLAKHTKADAGVWAGDSDSSASGDPPFELPRAPTRPWPEQGPVSQGAYVPRPRYLENLPSRWWFVAERCPVCRALTFPVRGRCRACGVREGLSTERLPLDGGEVVAATVIGPGGQPTEFDDQVESSGPYEVVLVEVAPGVRLTLQVTDGRPGELAIGARVATRLRRLYPMEGEWRYGRKAVSLR